MRVAFEEHRLTRRETLFPETNDRVTCNGTTLLFDYFDVDVFFETLKGVTRMRT